eukprot:c25097_g14_i2 orf=124-711(+)
MSSSLSCLVSPTSYGASSPLLLRRRLTFVEGKVPCWRARAVSKEEASEAVKAPSAESPKARETESDPSSRSAKGFGPRPPPPPPKAPKPTPSSKDKQPLTRRPAPARPILLPDVDPAARDRENAFVLSLTAVGILIFIEGIAVASSGLLPDKWDALVVKYVYPAFTPTVGLFLAGAVLYGVLKINQGGEKSDESS